MLPTSGTVNCSLWDASSTEDLLLWLQETLDIECTHEVFEVLEDFALGLPKDLARMRAAESVAQGTRDMGTKAREATAAAVGVVSHQMQELDSKLHVSEQATHLAKAARSTGAVAVQNAAAMLSKVQLFARNASAKAMENEHVAATVSTLDTSWRRIAGGGSGAGSGAGSVVGAEEVNAGGDDDGVGGGSTTSSKGGLLVGGASGVSGTSAVGSTEGGATAKVEPASTAAPASPRVDKSDASAPVLFTLGDEDEEHLG